MKPLWLEYRPDKLFFRGGGTVRFQPTSRMLYNPTDHVIYLENPGAAAVRQMAANHSLGNAELARIEYSMLVNVPGHRTTLEFFHPLDEGAGVRLAMGANRDWFFVQDDGRPIFSKNYSLRSLTDGKIPDNRPVWQFHGYRHEH